MIVIAASGPSLSQEQADICRRHGVEIMVVNDAYRLMPWANYHYASDYKWWAAHHDKAAIRPRFTNNSRAMREFGISATGIAMDGCNSGSHAMLLAYSWGKRRIALIGFDFGHSGGKAHFFGDHPKEVGPNATGCRMWLERLPRVISRMPGAKLVNCSSKTAIPETLIPRGDLEETLCLWKSAT